MEDFEDGDDQSLLEGDVIPFQVGGIHSVLLGDQAIVTHEISRSLPVHELVIPIACTKGLRVDIGVTLASPNSDMVIVRLIT